MSRLTADGTEIARDGAEVGEGWPPDPREVASEPATRGGYWSRFVVSTSGWRA
ncbi:hypothetical protein ACNS7O_10720 [Haloferacaceae archaeon DSL9]